MIHHCLYILIVAACSVQVFSQTQTEHKLRTIVIDAGHGGKDPGAIGKKSKEKDITLALALKTGSYIEENLSDVKVIYTRKTDKFVELHKRADIANKNNADLFISIHVNANPNPKAKGTDSWVMGEYKEKENLEVAKLENKVISIEDDHSSNYQGFDNTTESYIIFNLQSSLSNEKSIRCAELVQKDFRTRVGRIDRGVKAAPFLVLWKTTMPSILIETGFITNEEEEDYLMSDEGQTYIASAIYRAFKEYKKEFDSKSSVHVEQALTDSISFAIQVFASKKKIKTIKHYQDEGFRIIESGTLFKYAIFENQEYDEVKSKLEEVRSNYPDAYLIAIYNDEIIPVNKALKIKNEPK